MASSSQSHLHVVATITSPRIADSQRPLCAVLCSTSIDSDDPNLCTSINVTWGGGSQCSSFYAICPANATSCILHTTGPQPSTLSGHINTTTFASCGLPRNSSKLSQTLHCSNSSFIVAPPLPVSTAQQLPSTTETISYTSRAATTTPPPPSHSDSSLASSTISLLSLLGGFLVVACVSFVIVRHRHRRRRRDPSTNGPAAHDDILDDDNAYMAMSPKPLLPPRAIPSDEQVLSPTSPTFLEYLDSVDAFRSLWLSMNAVRLVPVKGTSRGLVAATVQGNKHVLKGIDYTTVEPSNLFRFGRAVQLVLALPVHPNLTRITGVARINWTHQFAVASEFMNKGSLTHHHVLAFRSTADAPFPRRQRLRLCADIAAALVHLHALGCVYGILHPEKVLLHEDVNQGTLIAKLNVLAMMDQAFVEVPQCAHRLGSMLVPYIAPESRHESKTYTAAGDVYALGVIIAQLLTGRVPFEATYHDLGLVRGDVHLVTHPRAVPYDIDVNEGLREVLHASTLSSSINEFPCGVPRFTNAPVENLVSSSPRPFSTIASALGPEAAVLGPSSQPPPTDASSPAAPLVGGIVGGLVVVALLAFLLIQRSRRRPPPPSPDLEGVPYTAASIIFTPNPPAPVVASAADSSTPSFVRSDIDDDIILDANHSSSAASRLVASRPDLIELWMPSLDQVKPNPLKGGDKDLKVVTVHGHKLVVRTSSASGFLDAVQFIRRFRHPHITSVVGVGCLQTSQSEVAVVTEFLDQGSLGAYLSRTVELVPLTRLRLALDVGRALQYLHATHNLAYGGVHPDKILVYRDHAASFDENTIVVRAKLNVFHLMTHEQRHQQRHQKRHLYQPKRTCCIPSSGVPNFVPFLAPERRQRMDPPTKPSDVFALAVVVGMIWTNERPHAALYDQQGLVRGDVYLATHPEETFPYLEGKLTGMAPSLSRVLWQCWHVDPAARPTIDAVVATLEQLLS
ncbi:hypothetical protein DYB36_001743 [Aphanomyces astaci]|uniref:Protein kinase domain-containing protein n=1 Tax=Aphanomyces astaci TaxID=112090 RepID=A0A397BFK8_APHAT|nr:hypothetical protein DYB36_001743 [Aphanomyces astaci]